MKWWDLILVFRMFSFKPALSLSSFSQFSCVRLFVTPWTAACQASLSITNSWSLLKLISIKLVMPSNRLILCRPLLLLPSVFPSIRVFSSKSVLCIRWPRYWSCSFSSPLCCCRWVDSVVSNSVRPHRRQPTGLPCPWDSPGKNSGVGCHFLLQCMRVKSESEVAQLCPTRSDPVDCSPPGSSVHGIFQARVLEWVPLPSLALLFRWGIFSPLQLACVLQWSFSFQ